MHRGLRIGLTALPWVLLAGTLFLAWLAWVHYQWKDRTLWERILTDVEHAPAHLAQLQRADSAAVVAAIEQRRTEDCRILREELHLAPARLAERAEAALAQCDGVDPVR